jgi:acyl-CoA synthetase (AMP-forming)/AMP-acid ligase II
MSRIVAVPMFHAAAAPSTHFGTIKSGTVNYIMRRFDLKEYLEASAKYQVTDMVLVPPLIVAFVMSPLTRQKPYFKSIRSADCGAAPLDLGLQAQFCKLLSKGTRFGQVWGMTETCCVAMQFAYPESDDTGSIGRLIPNVEVKLIDDDGNNISAYGVQGELCVRGPTVTPGYFNNDAANRETFDSDGWLKTGDVVYCDQATNKWYIVDRKKELIKVRGFQVAPNELEGVLLSHPQIVDAAVIGVPAFSIRDGEMPRAYVVRRPGSEEALRLTEKDLVEYVGTRLAHFKALTGGVKFVDAIPKNASGKLLKRMLREEYKKEMEKENRGNAKL